MLAFRVRSRRTRRRSSIFIIFTCRPICHQRHAASVEPDLADCDCIWILASREFATASLAVSRLSAINRKYRTARFTPIRRSRARSPIVLFKSTAPAQTATEKATIVTDRQAVRPAAQPCGVKANHPLGEAEGVCRCFRSVSPGFGDSRRYFSQRCHRRGSTTIGISRVLPIGTRRVR